MSLSAQANAYEPSFQAWNSILPPAPAGIKTTLTTPGPNQMGSGQSLDAVMTVPVRSGMGVRYETAPHSHWMMKTQIHAVRATIISAAESLTLGLRSDAHWSAGAVLQQRGHSWHFVQCLVEPVSATSIASFGSCQRRVNNDPCAMWWFLAVVATHEPLWRSCCHHRVV